MDESKPITVAGIEIPAEERTPLVDCLLRVIQQQGAEIRGLRDEIARLKGLPPRPTIRASTLNAPHPDPSHKKKHRGKRPGSAKRQKTDELTIHETIPVPLEELPEGTQQNGYEDFVVQELKIEAHNVCYRRLRYLLPDGSSRTAPLPAHVQGHFGAGLRSYVLYQHHQNGVTQPLIHEELLDLGIDISTVRSTACWRKATTGSTRRRMPCCRRRGRCRAISRPTTRPRGTWERTPTPR